LDLPKRSYSPAFSADPRHERLELLHSLEEITTPKGHLVISLPQKQVLELILMITFVMQLRWSSISKAYDEF